MKFILLSIVLFCSANCYSMLMEEIEMVQDFDKISFGGSHSGFRSVTHPQSSTKLNFKYFFALYKIKRSNNGNPVIITKDDFKNIPDYFVFKNIIIN